jgi:hypothetical protein
MFHLKCGSPTDTQVCAITDVENENWQTTFINESSKVAGRFILNFRQAATTSAEGGQ